MASSKPFHPNQISPSFCVLPWIHLSTRPNGHLRLCCTANASSAGATNDKVYGGEVGILKTKTGKPANLNVSDLNSAWNNDYMKSVRRQMLNGEEPVSCSKCYKEERAGHLSKRIWESQYWAKELEVESLIRETTKDGEVPPRMYYVDLRLGTKCNLKCIMCSPHDSSLWVSDWEKLHPQIESPSLKEIMQWNNRGQVDGASYDWHLNNPDFWQQLFDQLPYMRQLYFAGGESTIIKEHYDLLEECVKRGFAKQIELRYNSNGIFLPQRLFDLWKEFRRVRFHFSIDSFGEKNSYIRYPSQWKVIEKNLRRLDETPDHVEITIACAVQILNIFYLPEMIKWKLGCGFKKINPWPLGAGLINYHFVYHPAHLNVKVLSLGAKQAIQEKFDAFYPWLLENYRSDADFLHHPYGIQRLKGLVSFMLSEDWSQRLPELTEYLEKMDKIRGTCFSSTFPELAQILSWRKLSE